MDRQRITRSSRICTKNWFRVKTRFLCYFCTKLEIIFEWREYDPHDPPYSKQEQVALDALALPETGDRVRSIMSVSSSVAQARQVHDYYSHNNA